MDCYRDKQSALTRMVARAQVERMDYCVTWDRGMYRVRPTGYARNFADPIIASIDGATLPQPSAETLRELATDHWEEAKRLKRERDDVIPNTAHDGELSCGIHFHARKSGELEGRADRLEQSCDQ